MSAVHVVVPHGLDDPERASGGNTYDRRACAELSARGWAVHEVRVAGDWPDAGAGPLEALATALRDVPDGALVLLDGIVASAAPEAVVPETDRLRLVVLVHLPLGAPAGGGPARVSGSTDARSRECRVLHAAAAVAVTSRWSRDWLVRAYGLAPDRVRVAPPGVDPAEVVPGSAAGDRLVVVGAVTPVKGHDVLVAALESVADLRWSCTVVGSTSVHPAFVARVRDAVVAAGLRGRVRLSGPRVGPALDAVYAAADVVVVPSRVETYGMVVTEALARAVPVVGAAVGGLPEAMGTAPGGRLPGLLVAPDDPDALAVALRRWLSDASLRDALRSAARSRRAELTGWPETGDRLSALLAEVAA